MDNRIVKVDVPKKKIDSKLDDLLTVEVTVDDIYILDGQEYDFKTLNLEMLARISSVEVSNGQMKIIGDRMAHYEAVFKLMAFAQINGLDPVLAYTKK